MALVGTITVTTGGNNIAFSTDNLNFRATALYVYNLNTTGNIYLDITTTSGCTTGYTVPPGAVSFPVLHGIRGFSSIASTAGGSISVAYLASR